MTQHLGQAEHRKARVYDRMEDGEGLEGPRSRFSEVDAAAEAWRPGAVVALASECDELLAAQRTGGGAASGAATNDGWGLTTLATEWSSRGKPRPADLRPATNPALYCGAGAPIATAQPPPASRPPSR